MRPSKRELRIGAVNINKWGDTMKVIEYYDVDNIIIEFQDEWKEIKKCQWIHFEDGTVVNPHKYKQRIGETKLNNQGCLMKIIEYIDSNNIVIEFQDNYKLKVTTTYNTFSKGQIKNPYYPSVYGVGITGNKYPLKINSKPTKEYNTWIGVLERCYSSKYKNKNQTYQSVTCCDEWLLFENFYEWLHSQENFDKWLNGDKWEIDKDILVKGNKIYSSDNCCLVPHNVNGLFIKKETSRGSLPIGVYKHKNKYKSICMNKYIGIYDTLNDAFYLGYKPYKEGIIKQVAQIEFDKNNITKRCYDAMMNYEVEITD